MATFKELATGRRDVFMIDPRQIKAQHGFNVREDYGDIDSLAASIAENGVKVPLEVRMLNGQVTLIDGHRRLQATMMAIENGADIVAVPCQPETRGTDDAERVLAMLIKNDGKPLDSFEERAAFRRLIDMGWSAGQVAKKIGKGLDYVNGRLNLGNVTPEVKEAVKSGKLSVTAATGLSKMPAEKQTEVVKKAKSEGKKVTTAQVHKATRGKTYSVPVTAINNLLDSLKMQAQSDPSPTNMGQVAGVERVLKLAE